jgi:hypothetical protein
MGARPLARSDGLVVEALGDELLVYDRDTDQAHSLDPAAAEIWRACDSTATPADIAARLNLDEAAVQASLKHLAELDLLTGEAAALTVTHSRRAVLRRGLVAGAAGAVAVPVISSIVAPPAHAQGSCQPSTPDLEECLQTCECTSGCCCAHSAGFTLCLTPVNCQQVGECLPT